MDSVLSQRSLLSQGCLPLTSSTDLLVMEKLGVIEKLGEKIDYGALFDTSLGFIGTIAFGFYTAIFIEISGWFLILAVPYGVITLLCGGWTWVSAKHIVK